MAKETIFRFKSEDEILAAALTIAENRFVYGEQFVDAKVTCNFMKIWAATKEHEVFGVFWLNTQHMAIGGFQELFRGTIDSAAVYPREIAKAALACNAAACILVHNHPSGDVTPSSMDRTLTKKISETLGVFDIRVLDHLIASPKAVLSFAEKGLMP